MGQATSRKLLSNIEMRDVDPILGLNEKYLKDPNPLKINLGMGVYRDNSGNPFVLRAVREAEKRILLGSLDKEYSPMTGIPEFPPLAARLAYGENSQLIKDGKVLTIQTLSGTGALKIGADFIMKFIPSKTIFLPIPTYGNHVPIFENSNLTIQRYRYYDKNTLGFDEAGAIEDIMKMPEKSAILFHACAHNPTGVDPTQQQWKEISSAVKKRNLFPFFDLAYQGFASGNLDEDAYALRYFIEQGHNIMVAQSFAKNMGLYGERVGTFSIVCVDMENAEKIESQVKIIVRSMYSMPPLHGARVASTILSDPILKELWLEDLKMMADRILSMRRELRKSLENEGSSRNWNHITDQIGMFCFTGLTEKEVDQLITKHSVYLTKDGRISISGINTRNVERLAHAIHDVTK